MSKYSSNVDDMIAYIHNYARYYKIPIFAIKASERSFTIMNVTNCSEEYINTTTIMNIIDIHELLEKKYGIYKTALGRALKE